jgi:hypothetical protein
VTIDHIVPYSRGGTNEPMNLMHSCSECNQAKGDRTLSEWASSRDQRAALIRDGLVVVPVLAVAFRRRPRVKVRTGGSTSAPLRLYPALAQAFRDIGLGDTPSRLADETAVM